MSTSGYVKALVGAHVVLIQNGSVFLIRRFNTGFSDGCYSIPAGHVDDGENIIDAAVREAREEAGITIDAHDLIFSHVVHIRKLNPDEMDRMQFFFMCERWQGEPTNCEPEKCDHADWFPIDRLPENMVTYVRQALIEHARSSAFSTLDE